MQSSIHSTVEMIVIESFQLRKVSASGHQFLFSRVIESGTVETCVKECFANDVKSEASTDLLKRKAKDKVIITHVVGKGGPSLRLLSNAMVSKSL